MYIVGRLLSLIIYAIVLAAVCYIITNSQNKKKINCVLILYIIILGFMGYFFIPHTGADLYRLLNTMKYYSNGDWSVIKNRILETSTPGTGLYFCLVGKLNNDHLLPAISVIITFSFCFYILKSESDAPDTKPMYIALALFAFMSRGLMMQIISNIRTIMALSICAVCVYMEFYKNKKMISVLPIYILAASLHVMGQVVFLYRIIFLMMEKARSPIQIIFRLICTGFLCSIVWIYGQKYLSSLFEKGDFYATSSATGNGYDYIWERILSVMSLLLLVYYLTKFFKYKKMNACDNSNNESVLNLVRYIYPLLFIDVIAFFIEFNFFQRLSWYICILTMPLMISTFKLVNDEKEEKILKENTIAYCILMLALACARGDLCSLKFFEL